jgi:Tfp pilus assembly protein PilN
LKDRRVLGEREITNPETGEKETIANYFPSIVSLEDFNTCRELMRQRDTAPGRHHGHGKKIKNLFQGVVFCRCGSRLSYTATHGGKYEHLKCRRRVEGTCPHKNDPYWKYDEKALLLAFMNEHWGKFFDRPKDSIERQKTEAEVLALEGVVAEYRQQEINAEKSMKAEITSANYDRETVAFIKKVAKEANNAADKAERQLQELRGKLQLLKTRPTGKEMKQQIEAKVKAFINGSLDDLEERRKLNNWLNTLGVKATLTNPELGRFQWGAMDAVVYRDSKGDVVLDETLTSMKAFGATEEQIETRRAEIEREIYIEKQLAKGIDLRP